MITKDNFKDVLTKIGFEKDSKSEYYKANYPSCSMTVDFDKEKLIYPESNGLVVNDKTTSNFSHPENFVVFECVCRLLDKGYRPEHIELEPRWTLGHDAKGGKADILVRDEEGAPLLIVECKTAGKEFAKEKKNTDEDGGQLFSYWQQEGATRWLSLYTSDFKNDNIDYTCLSINCTDDANIEKIAEKDTDLHIYKNARNDKERFQVWRDTYGQQWLNDVVFCDESQAYRIGIPPLRKGQLHDFSPDDRIVNKFEEILRHNNVSDKENAFNRLVALFICKLVDEIKKQDLDEVDFQYKQGADTYESLQDRLQRLHQQGMEEFMKEKIFYVEADYAERLFQQYTGRQRKAAIEDLNQTIRILKFYSNNDFAFKDVHNEELFFQNGKILVEVVQLFQPYRIVYPSKHQFLGDLFEQLLNKGFKQNEGQFFTPTPITRFIWDSLPLQQYISQRDIPRIIDYACGAGHFLTEAVEAVNAVRKDGDNSWVEKHIYGVEKDYRLARVSKISMFMNGAGGANIIFGDGLENYSEKGITNGTFDILVANPPYSVSGFKQHLKLKNNTFDILDKITLDGSDIETLFVERISQLLKPQGIAAVVLPASILSNSSSSYIAAREQLLQHFMIHAIVNFGSKTFGATGTNTVVLFLERYNEPPKVSAMAKDIVDGIMSNTDCSDWQDKEIMEDYLSHQGISEDTYVQFLSRTMPWEMLQADHYFKPYTEFIAASAISYPKKATAEQKAEIRLNKFYDYATALERDKLYYFALVRNQKTIVVTAPTDNKEQKTFLGYDWSNRKGAEGIVINKMGGQLFNDADRFDANTIAALIRFSFYGDIQVCLPDEIQKYVKSYELKDMIEFKKCFLDNSFHTPSELEIAKPQSKYPLVRFSEIIGHVNGDTTKIANNVIVEKGAIPVVSQESGKLISGYVNDVTPITDLPLIVFGDHSCTIKYIDFAFVRGADGTQLIKIVDNRFDVLYVYHYLKNVKIHNRDKYERHFKYLKDSFIPLPPTTVQHQIVAECKKIEDEYNTSRMTIETYRQKIADIFHKLDVVKLGVVKISELAKYITERTKNIDTSTYVTTDNMLQAFEGIKPFEGTTEADSAIAFKKGDVLLSNIRPYLKKLWLADNDGSCSPDVLVFRADTSKVYPEFFYYSLRRDEFIDYVMNSAGTKGIKMPRGNKDAIPNYSIVVPSLEKQVEILTEINQYEKQIKEAQIIMKSCESRKQAILDKYLR